MQKLLFEMQFQHIIPASTSFRRIEMQWTKMDGKGLQLQRRAMGLSQEQMAEKMGLSLRAYADIEAGKTLRLLHLMAAQMVSLREAVRNRNVLFAFPEVRELVHGFTGVEEENRGIPKMSTLTISMARRHEFDRRWRAFTDEKAKAVRQAGGLSIIIDPVMQGPGIDGRITYYDVHPEFLAQLRKEGFEED